MRDIHVCADQIQTKKPKANTIDERSGKERNTPHTLHGDGIYIFYVVDKSLLGLVHGNCSHCGRLTKGKTYKEPKRNQD